MVVFRVGGVFFCVAIWEACKEEDEEKVRVRARVCVCVRGCAWVRGMRGVRAWLRHRGAISRKVNIMGNARQLDSNFAVNI